MKSSDKGQSKAEERANWITHAIGVVLIPVFFPDLYALAALRGAPGMTRAVLVFGLGMLMAYLASTIYHFVPHPATKRKLRIWDHIGIFFLIGGTYTPVVIQYTSAATATWFLGTMWSIIAAGSLLKIFFTGKYQKVSVGLYLALGWMAVLIYQPLSENMSFYVFQWILAGGLAYTIGVVFYRWHRLPYQHAIWHLFVLAGTGCHFVAVFVGM